MPWSRRCTTAGRSKAAASSTTATAGVQYVSISYTERLAEAGIEPSVGSVGDSYDNALAETIIGLFKTEVIRRLGPWRILEAVEFATLEWVDWFNNRRLLEPIGNIPPAEAEARYYAQLERAGLGGVELKPNSLRQTRRGSNPRFRAAMMASGSARQTNGLGLWLCSAMKRLMAAWRSTTEQKTPCLSRRRASLAKKPSTALSQEHEVGVKWKVQRGWRSSQARTFGCLCAA